MHQVSLYCFLIFRIIDFDYFKLHKIMFDSCVFLIIIGVALFRSQSFEMHFFSLHYIIIAANKLFLMLCFPIRFCYDPILSYVIFWDSLLSTLHLFLPKILHCSWLSRSRDLRFYCDWLLVWFLSSCFSCVFPYIFLVISLASFIKLFYFLFKQRVI